MSTIDLGTFQVEEGSTATEYEPPAPTPDYPIEIESLNDFDVVSSVGKRNLHLGSMNTNSLNFRSNNGAVTPMESGVENGINWFTQKNEPENTFEISIYVTQAYDDNNNYGNIFSEELKDYEGDLTYAVDFMSQEPVEIRLGSSETVRLEPNKWTRFYDYRTKGSRPSGPSGATQPNIPVGTKVYWRNYSIYKGHIQNKYSPAPEDITSDTDPPLIDKINLSLSEPLRSVGDVKDRIFRDSDGLWKVERNVGEVELKGTKGWSTDGYRDKGYNYAYFNPGNLKRYREVRSNILPQGDILDDTRGDSGGTTVIVFNLKDSRTGVTSTDNADNRVLKIRDYLLSIEGAMVSYELATPTTETLDQELQDKLNTLKSFKGSNYVYTVQNTDNPHKEQLKPTLHATFNSKDYLKETRTLTNLLIWARELTDGELIHHNQLFLNRFNLQSDTVSGEPIEQTLNLLHGGMVGHSLEQNYTINI